jgi:hypothetical protein
MSRPDEAAPALIYKEGDDLVLDGEVYDDPFISQRSAQLTLTDAQIKAWPSGYITMVAAQGEGTIIFPHSMTWDILSTEAYTNTSASLSVDVKLGTATVHSVSEQADSDNLTNVLTSGSNEFWFKSPLVGDTSEGFTAGFENQPLRLYFGNAAGNFTGGDAGNTLTITVNYSVSSR